jgi:hypothetical protein
VTGDLLINLLAALIAFCAGLGVRSGRAWALGKLRARRERVHATRRRPEYAAAWIVEYYRARGRANDLFAVVADGVENRIPFLVRPQWYADDLVETDLLRQQLPHRKSTVALNHKVLGRRPQYMVGLDDGEPWNDLHACALKVEETPNGPRIEVGVCEYFQYMSVCGALEDETYAAVERRRARTRLRDRVLPDAAKALECAMGAHSIGMTVAIVFGGGPGPVGPGSHKVLIQRRSQAVSTYGGALGVVPMFSCQSSDLTERTQVSLTHNFLREVYEELYNGEQVQRQTPRVDPGWFLQDPVMEPMLRYMQGAESSLQILGFGFDALNGQLIVGGLVNLGISEFAPTELGQMYGNWEVNNIEIWDLFGAPLTEALLASRFTPACAFTLARTRERLRDRARIHP